MLVQLVRRSLAAIATFAAVLLLSQPTFADEPRRPNIVLILADDLGINDLGCYGRKEHSTPNLDRLASHGVRFTSAYCAQPICSASRAGLLTGLAPARLHLTTYLPGRPDTPAQKLLHPKIEQQLALEYATLAERLRSAGYATACIGKWHLGGDGFGPKEQGFDFVHAGKANTQPSDVEGGKGEFDLTHAAIGFIEQQQAERADQPFFLYLPHNNPHIPLAARQELVDKHRDAFNPIYAAVVETLDDSVGLLLDKLDELKLADNTIVIFLSDNGGLHVLEFPETPATHNTPFRAGKGFNYEGGLRVPAIVRYSGNIAAGQVSETPITGADWAPTLLALCRVQAETQFDGVDITPALPGKPLPPRTLYWHFPHYTNQGSRPGGAVREGDWKLIEHYDTDEAELYNLADDLGEANDLAGSLPGRVAQLRGKLAAWRKAIGAQENERNPNFDPVLFQKLYVDNDVSKLKPAATAASMEPKLKAWREGMNGVVSEPRTKVR